MNTASIVHMLREAGNVPRFYCDKVTPAPGAPIQGPVSGLVHHYTDDQESVTCTDCLVALASES